MRHHLIVAVVLLALGSPVASAGAQTTTPNATGPVIRTTSFSGWFDHLVGWAQVATPLVALAGLIFIWKQIKQQRDEIKGQKEEEEGNRNDARANRSVSYQATYTDRAFLTTAGRCTGFLDAADAADCVSKIRAHGLARWADERSLPRTPPSVDEARASRNDLNYLLGFFETMANAYNANIIDRDLIKRDFAQPAAWYYAYAWWFLCWRREMASAAESQLYDQFDTFVRSLRSDRADVRKIKPNADLRVLCLPAETAVASTWAIAGRISNALSRRALNCSTVSTCLLAALEEAVEKVEGAVASGPASAPGIETVIVVPNFIEVPDRDWEMHRKRATEIKQALNRAPLSRLDAVARSL
jgi:hypothetical protein